MFLTIFLLGVSARPVESISVHPDECRQVPGFLVLADRRLFAVMAFLNAVGFDDEAKGMQMAPLRVKVRQMVAANLQNRPDKLAQWKRQYGRANFIICQNYAVRLTPDYPFRPAFPIPFKKLGKFHETLNDFWRTANLDTVWEAMKPGYLAELDRYPPERMRSAVDSLWAYLRMSRSDSWTFAIIPNPLSRNMTALAAHPGAYYYIVVGPGVRPGFNDHEYLHSIVDPIVKARLGPQERKLRAYFKASHGRTRYYGTVASFTGECLIHALSPRLRVRRDDTPENRAANDHEIDDLMQAGFLLVRPFYDLLASFEAGNLPFDQFVPQLFERLPPCRP